MIMFTVIVIITTSVTPDVQKAKEHNDREHHGHA